MAGIGVSLPDDEDVDGTGTGGYGEVEYVYRRVAWLTPRAYTGVLITRPRSDCGAGVSPCDVSSGIFFIGGKLRLMAPIPYVGPFIESGIGLSAGRISTRSGQSVDRTSSGVMYHVPVGLGLAIGPHHEFEISLQYLFHPEQEQISGAVAAGFRFNLG
jgi:hypothetical protein